jgi:Cu(I)/Ag(I) efflux system periplasmic protein CusF
MKTTTLLLSLALLGDHSCSSDAVEIPAAQPDATTASASGVVEAVDVAAKTITTAHEPVDTLKWPAMTMTFQAPMLT